MKLRTCQRRGVLAAPLLLLGAAAARAEREEWRDAARGRTVPVRLRFPLTRVGAPVVIVSHGLGGSRDGLAYLGAALAEAGFVAVHLQHAGSDSAMLRGPAGAFLGMAGAVLDVRNALDRLGDVAFALDTLAERMDIRSCAIAGHSFGAWTVTHMLGERLPLGTSGLTLPDPRLRAGIALSPIPPVLIPPASAFEHMLTPMLHVTGTRDRGLIEAVRPEERTIPYRDSHGPAVLAVLAGANHAAFAGEEGAGRYWNDPTYQGRTSQLAVRFLQAVLLGDGAARARLLRGAGLAQGDRIESRKME